MRALAPSAFAIAEQGLAAAEDEDRELLCRTWRPFPANHASGDDNAIWQAVVVERRLLDDVTLARSAVVANRDMNRERQLTGPNSYERELGFDPLAFLRARIVDRGRCAWLDVCCGQGRALSQAGRELARLGLTDQSELIGLDLVDYFDRPPEGITAPATFVCAPLLSFAPSRRYDLITCVHGLHYVGDKLAALGRIAGWLADDGVFVADLDLASVRLSDGQPAGRMLSRSLRTAGFTYDGRRKRIGRRGHADVRLPYEYLGGDAVAGPNYTRQPAVDSYYRRASGSLLPR